MLAVAGAGKTTYIINKVCAEYKKVLIITYTDANYNNKFKQTNAVEDGDRMFYNGMFTSGKKNIFVYSSKFKNFLGYSL